MKFLYVILAFKIPKATTIKVATSRKPTRMATEGEDEDEMLGSSFHWKESDVDILITLHREM